MPAKGVGATGPRSPRLLQRLRAMTPAWAITRREAHWIAERQARLLLADAGITAPPVPERIVTELDGVRVYPFARIPVKGLLGASKPSAKGGDILIDATLPLPERRVTLMHELKHIIDGGHTTRPHQRGSQTSREGLCTDFALSLLMPASWLRADWHAGHRSIRALAERYQVPTEAVTHRLQTLGLRQHPTPRLRRHYCQWQPQTHAHRNGTRPKGDVRKITE